MVQLLVSHEFESGLKQTSKQFGSHVNFNMCKPGPPRFAWSSGTILVISSSHLPKTDPNKVQAEDISNPVWLRKMQHYNIIGDK